MQQYQSTYELCMQIYKLLVLSSLLGTGWRVFAPSTGSKVTGQQRHSSDCVAIFTSENGIISHS